MPAPLEVPLSQLAEELGIEDTAIVEKIRREGLLAVPALGGTVNPNLADMVRAWAASGEIQSSRKPLRSPTFSAANAGPLAKVVTVAECMGNKSFSRTVRKMIENATYSSAWAEPDLSGVVLLASFFFSPKSSAEVFFGGRTKGILGVILQAIHQYWESPNGYKPWPTNWLEQKLPEQVVLIINEAERLRLHVGSDKILASRHIAGAMSLMVRKGGIVERLSALEREVLADALAEFVFDNASLRERRIWWNVLGARHEEISEAERGPLQSDYVERDTEAESEMQERGYFRFHYDADRVVGKDCLRVERDARAMGNLIASRHLMPPLAVGLFGDWGSGKSFFMRTLRGVVGELAGKSQRGEVDGYWGNIRQIEFNAWHYVDSNLWASLVARILEGLSDRKERGVSEEIEKALKSLDLAAEAKAAAVEKVEVAKAALGRASESFKEATKNFKEKEKLWAEAVAKTVWEDVWKDDDVKAAWEPAKKAMGELSVEATDIQASLQVTYEEAKRLAGTAGTMGTLMGSMLMGRGLGQAVVVFVLVTAVGAVGVVLAATYGAKELATAGAFLAEAAAMVAGVAWWIKENAKKVRGMMGALTPLRNAVDRSLESVEAKRREAIAKAKAEVDLQQARVIEAEKEKEKAEVEFRLAEARKQELLSGAFIARFIQQRLDSGDYQKHLGLVAKIRGDFEKLDGMIGEHNRRQIGRGVEGVEVPNLGINRVVLYIDDLDRCPPETVVKMLEAIHLLLAFESFVVVVGVDARWACAALKERYSGLLAYEGEVGVGLAGGGVGAARPEDYLEKIFQIPFWLQPLTGEGTKRLLGSLIGGEVGEGVEVREEKVEVAAVGVGASLAAPVVAGERRLLDAFTLREDGSLGAIGAKETVALLPERLAITEGERGAMEELGLLLGRSPRAVKRFVNVYRLLKASHAGEREKFERECRHVMFLLALVSNRELMKLFDWLRNAQHSGALKEVGVLPEEVKRLLAEPKVGEEWGKLEVPVMQGWVGRVRQFSFMAVR